MRVVGRSTDAKDHVAVLRRCLVECETGCIPCPAPRCRLEHRRGALDPLVRAVAVALPASQRRQNQAYYKHSLLKRKYA
jgi:hypothetical protein